MLVKRYSWYMMPHHASIPIGSSNLIFRNCQNFIDIDLGRRVLLRRIGSSLT